MKFSNSKFNIEVVVGEIEGNLDGTHNRETNILCLDINKIKDRYELWTRESQIEQVRKVVIHELTHWFDENCYEIDSAEHRRMVLYEALATFNTLFLNDIVEFTDMIMESKMIKKYFRRK